jgi:hypothetical protein
MISAVLSVSSVYVELDNRLSSNTGRTDETTKYISEVVCTSAVNGEEDKEDDEGGGDDREIWEVSHVNEDY